MGKIADALRGANLPQQMRAQVVALDREFVEMESQVQVLQSEKLHLEAKVNPLEREVERLKQQVHKQPATYSPDDEELAILKLLASHDRITSQQIQQHLQMHRVHVERALASLRKQKFIVDFVNDDGYAIYCLDDNGNEYLVKNKLV